MQITYINYTENFAEKKSLIAKLVFGVVVSRLVAFQNWWSTDTAFWYRQGKKQNPVTGLTSTMQQQMISEDFPLKQLQFDRYPPVAVMTANIDFFL